MLTGDTTKSEWLELIRAEYTEIPGLTLSKAEIRRFWGLDPFTCDALIDALIADGFLKRTSGHLYARATLGA